MLKICAPRCQVIWGDATNTYTADQLSAGVNLADDFAVNPFSAAFKQVVTSDPVAIRITSGDFTSGVIE